MEANYAKKQYRIVGLTVFIISIALLVMRIISYYTQVAMLNVAMDEAWKEILFDVIFSVPVQVGLLLIFPLLMYKKALKKKWSGLAEFSGYRKCNIWVCLLSVVLGFFIIFVTIGVSFFWQLILIIFGYIPSGGGTLPEQFNIGYFLASIFLTACLPAICEEFTNRGGLLTTMRSSFSKGKTILLIAIAFGLFHQNITQVFYTALLGALLAFLVLETQSVYPAIIVHFMNNFMSLYLENASEYNWKLGGGVYDFINARLLNFEFEVLMPMLALCLLIVFGLVVAIVTISHKTRKNDFYLELNSAVSETGCKICKEDNIFFIGAIVVTSVSTLFTYIFGI